MSGIPKPLKMKGAAAASSMKDDSVISVSDDKFSKAKHRKDPAILDMKKEDKRIREWLTTSNRAISDGKVIDVKIPSEINKQAVSLYQDISARTGEKDFVLELSDNGFRARRKIANTGESVVEYADFISAKKKSSGDMIIETADDDRVIGIPYTIANVGADKYYVINGRVYSGWAMWYGLQAIRSPEDYARNVDLLYNVPFVWAGFNMKAQLSLGAAFDVTHGTEEEETPEESFIKELMFRKLKINIPKLTKTSFHLDTYGNAYWHIRRDRNGMPDKITILMPERVKVFLDPKTTKVLYYIYLPPVLAGMALTPYPNIRENPNLLHGPALTYPTPIVIDPQDIIHFRENSVTEYPFGISTCKSMIDPCTARMDINVLAPMIFKKYAKPMIHWRLDPMLPFQLTKGQIEGYISGMKDTLENMEPMSDPVTSTRWTANPIGAAQGKAELLTILQDLDNQIFASIGVPESYFKPQGMSDRMVAEQDKTLIASMQQRQDMVGDFINDQIIRPAIDRYDQIINMNLVEAGMEQMPPRPWNGYPELQWRETFKQDQVTTIQNTLALQQAGIIDRSRAARRVGEMPPAQSEELRRQMDLAKVNEQVQLQQAALTMLQLKLEEMQMTYQLQQGPVEPALSDQGGQGGGGQSSGDSGGKSSDRQANQKFRVTFTNRYGKKQTETMRGDTLKKLKSGGTAVQQVVPVGSEPAKGGSQEQAGQPLK